MVCEIVIKRMPSCRHCRVLYDGVIQHYAIHGSIYRKNRTDIRYLTTNTDTEVSTSVFRLLKNIEYRKFSLFGICTSVN